MTYRKNGKYTTVLKGLEEDEDHACLTFSANPNPVDVSNLSVTLKEDSVLCVPGAAKQSSPLTFSAVFSATVRNFNLKLHTFIF